MCAWLVFGGEGADMVLARLAYGPALALPYVCWLPFLLVVVTGLSRRRWLAMFVIAGLFTVLKVSDSSRPVLTVPI